MKVDFANNYSSNIWSCFKFTAKINRTFHTFLKQLRYLLPLKLTSNWKRSHKKYLRQKKCRQQDHFTNILFYRVRFENTDLKTWKNTIFAPSHLNNLFTWLDSLTYVTLDIIHTEKFWVRQSEKKFHSNETKTISLPLNGPSKCSRKK